MNIKTNKHIKKYIYMYTYNKYTHTHIHIHTHTHTHTYIYIYIYILYMAPKRHEHLSHHHLGDTKASPCLQQDRENALFTSTKN